MSWTIAVNDRISRAKKAVSGILNCLSRMRCNSAKVFFKMFDAQAQPMLLYGSEVWGYTKYDSLEKVHLFACKRFLKISLRAPNNVVYGELGRHPLYINSAASCIRYWFKLLKQHDLKYSKCAYNMLLELHNRGRANWVTYIRNLLCLNGFSYVWTFGSVGNENTFITEFKKRLKDVFCQEWFSYFESKCDRRLYSEDKCCLERERYIDIITFNTYRVALARFRIGVSEINFHKFRYASIDEKRNCPFCKNVLEDEVHVMFLCPVYKDIRQKHLSVAESIPYNIQLAKIFSSRNDDVIFNSSRFIYYMYQERRKQLNDSQH